MNFFKSKPKKKAYPQMSLNECAYLINSIPCNERSRKLVDIHEDINDITKYWPIATEVMMDYMACCKVYYADKNNKDEYDDFVHPILKLIANNPKIGEHAKEYLDRLQLNNKNLQFDPIVNNLQSLLNNNIMYQKGGRTHANRAYVNRAYANKNGINKIATKLIYTLYYPVNNINIYGKNNLWNKKLISNGWDRDIDYFIYYIVRYTNIYKNKSAYIWNNKKYILAKTYVLPVLDILKRNKYFTKKLLLGMNKYKYNSDADFLFNIISKFYRKM